MKVVTRGGVTLYDYEPKEDFAADVLVGLHQKTRRIPSKYFYDKTGSELFERICELPEYYVTRTELAIMRAHINEMAATLGPRCAVVEPGAGSGAKTRMLLGALEDPVAYIPLDISKKFLLQTAIALAADFPELEVAPICADYLGEWELPPLQRPARSNAVFFPGSTIGNMEPEEAQTFLRRLAAVCRSSRQRPASKVATIKGQGSVQAAQVGMLVGVDLRKDPDVIAAAYNDAEGVTRDFNLNLVTRMNRELGTDIPPRAVSHYTHYDESAGRNESFLLVREPLKLTISGQQIDIAAGERIRVERSYKYDLEQLAALAAGAGLRVERVWMDEQRWFSVQYLTADGL